MSVGCQGCLVTYFRNSWKQLQKHYFLFLMCLCVSKNYCAIFPWKYFSCSTCLFRSGFTKIGCKCAIFHKNHFFFGTWIRVAHIPRSAATKNFTWFQSILIHVVARRRSAKAIEITPVKNRKNLLWVFFTLSEKSSFYQQKLTKLKELSRTYHQMDVVQTKSEQVPGRVGEELEKFLRWAACPYWVDAARRKWSNSGYFFEKKNFTRKCLIFVSKLWAKLLIKLAIIFLFYFF